MTYVPIRPLRRFSLRARAGVALVMAVVAMAVLGALVTGVFFSALREQRDGRDAIQRAQALGAAEYGLAMAISPVSWRSSWNLASRRGPLADFALEPDTGIRDSVRVWKLGRNSFMLTSTGVSGFGASSAVRRLALLVTLRVPALALRSGAIARYGVAVGDSSLIAGADTVPTGWTCPPAESERPALVMPPGAPVDTSACTELPCIAGAPAMSVDSLAGAAETYERFGTLERESVADLALQLAGDVVLSSPAPALDGAGRCDVDRVDNLGDPLRNLGPASPCADHFPVLHSPGNTRIEGGAGQGMLLVDGNLTLAGGAHFSGVAVVRGVLEITERSELHGSVLASSVSVHDGSRIRYSSCAVERALRGAAEPVVPEGLAWSEAY
jgi:hypothetical protein